MTRRWQPKRWAPPKAWRSRNQGEVSLADVLKEFYDDGYRRPEWARQAYARHWMTSAQFYAVRERVPSGRRMAFRYEDAPFLGLVRKAASFDKVTP